MKIFVISLRQSVKRRESISSQLKNLNLDFEFVDAFLGAEYYSDSNYYNPKKAEKFNHRPLKPGEVGCALSHNAVYRKIAEEKLPFALILEDDIVISKDLPKVIDIIEKKLTGSKVITIDRCDVYKKNTKQHLFDDYYVVKPRYIREGGIANTSGYFVTLEAAEKMQHVNLPVWCTSDTWAQYKGLVEFYGVIPTQTVVHQNKTEFNSTIQSDGIGITQETGAESDEEISCFSAKTLFLYGLKTYIPVTSHIYRFIRFLYRHTIKPVAKAAKAAKSKRKSR